VVADTNVVAAEDQHSTVGLVEVGVHLDGSGSACGRLGPNDLALDGLGPCCLDVDGSDLIEGLNGLSATGRCRYVSQMATIWACVASQSRLHCRGTCL
jgi:hypothetical protein